MYTWSAYGADGKRCAPAGAPRLLLLYLAERANPDGVLWWRVEKIAEDLHRKRRTIQLGLRRLEALGELVTVRGGWKVGNPGAHDEGIPNVYVIVGGRDPAECRRLGEAKLVELGGKGARNCALHGPPARPERAQSLAGKGAISGAQWAQRLAPQPTVNRSENRAPPSKSHGSNAAVVHPIGAVEDRKPDTVRPAGASERARLLCDPEAIPIQKRIEERRADFAQQTGAMSGASIGSAANKLLAEADGQPARSADRPQRRIAETEQDHSSELLRKVPGVDRPTARGLARERPYTEVKRAVAALARHNGTVRNPGGWLRQALRKGWFADGDKEKDPAA